MRALFSVDDHIIEPAGVWVDRLPAKLRDVGPHVIERDGIEYWAYEDKLHATLGLAATAGKPRTEWDMDPQRFADMIPGCYDPKARAKDILSNGIAASVLFPTLPRFGGALFLSFADRELADLCVRAYNDFVIDEWCAGGPPGLFVPTIIGQLWDPELMAAEIRRSYERGARALAFPEGTSPLGLPSLWSDAWNPVWDVCQETGMPICMHIGSSGVTYKPSVEAPQLLQTILNTVGAYISVVDLALGPPCRKFPNLKFVFSEGGMGWIPAVLERADREFTRHFWQGLTGPVPSEIFQQNMFACMIDEPIGLRFRNEVGIDKIMWEADYPHPDTPWPNTQEAVDELFEGIPEPDIDAITRGNAERVFDWKMAELPLVQAD